MNAPLARYLTQFSAPPLARGAEISSPFDPRISLTAEDLEGRLERAAGAARLETELRLRSETEALLAANEMAAVQTLDSARNDWVASQSECLTKQITEAVSELREAIAERLARVLRPIASDSFVKRAVCEVAGALEKVLSDADRPALSVRGPADLVEALRQRCDAVSIEWVVAEECEVSAIIESARLETDLGQALATIAATDC